MSRKIALALTAALVSAHVVACPELDELTRRHGISFSGFMTPIPAVKHPTFSGKGELVRMPLATPFLVSDGFRHTVTFDTVTRKAWILRTGGFAGVREWYGPVEVGDAKLENCRPAPRKESGLDDPQVVVTLDWNR